MAQAFQDGQGLQPLAGGVWPVGGRPQVVFGFTVRGGRVVGIELLGDPETLDVLHLEPMEE